MITLVQSNNNNKRSDHESKHDNLPHWMKCPKCGDEMIEINLLNIMIEQCQGCSGLFFDSGELETLLDVSDRRGFFASLKRTYYN